MSHPANKARLQQAILADPDSEAVRLVYADWLEENGQTEEERDLAEFIRVQCQLARINQWGEEYIPLEIRSRELLSLHRPAWTQPIQPFFFGCGSTALCLCG
jgi:uncharacterized protein (TIGR02996 family)